MMMHQNRSCRGGVLFLFCVACVWANISCTPPKGNALDHLETARISIGDEDFEVWIADTDETREKGLMFIEADLLADKADGTHRGMLFVFEHEQMLGFYMKNTITALDIAFADDAGEIVKTHTMKPLDLNTYPSEKPSKFALEVKANLFVDLGIKTGQTITIPDPYLKNGG